MGSAAYVAKASPGPKPRKIGRLLALASARTSALASSTLARVTLASLAHDHLTAPAALARRSPLSSTLNATAPESCTLPSKSSERTKDEGTLFETLQMRFSNDSASKPCAGFAEAPD